MRNEQTPTMSYLLEAINQQDFDVTRTPPPELLRAWSYGEVRRPEIVDPRQRRNYEATLEATLTARRARRSSAAEVRKNSRVLYQALNQQTLFKKLPKALCIEIAGLTGDTLDMFKFNKIPPAARNRKTAIEIATENFERPSSLIRDY